MSDYEGWHRRFAWWPTWVEDGSMVWLEWVAVWVENYAHPADPKGVDLVVFARRWNDHVKEMLS